MRRSSFFWTLALLLAVLSTSGCVFRTRPVEEKYSTAPLKQATQQGLINLINQQAQAIQSLKATADIDTSAGGIKKGRITDYKEIRGYVLARKPEQLHMIGLMPIVRTTAFDMVSDGQQFKLWIPPKNRFVEGLNQTPIPNADHPMENIRPQNFYDAFLIPAIDPETEIAVMENGYETLHDNKGHPVLQADYELIVIRKVGNAGELSRKIIFGRTDLKPHQQLIYNAKADLATSARYAQYKDFNGVTYPSRIEITRPLEEYDITFNLLKVEINTALTDEQFTLQQPPGAEVVDLDHPQQGQITPLRQEADPR
jgi:hypothetical protein